MSSDHKQLPVTPEQIERLPPEIREIIQAIIDHYETRISELEERLGKNPSNSSLPPSSQHPHARPAAKSKPKSRRKRGGQKGHKKHERTLVPPEEVSETVVLKPEHCRCCSSRLRGTDSTPVRHQVWELPEIKPIITEYQRHRLQCHQCGTRTTAPLPEGVPQGQSGPRLTAFASLLMAYYRQSKRRTASFLKTILNIPCSSGLTVKLQNIMSEALKHSCEELHEALPQSTSVKMDETAMRESNVKSWLWTAVTKSFTLFAIRPTRGAEVAKELLGSDFSGVATSDRFGSYDWITQRQLCWAHLKRDFQSLVDAGGKAKEIGEKLLEQTSQLFHHWQRYRDGTIKIGTLRRNMSKLWWPVFESLEEGTLTLRGKRAGMCQHILDRVDSLWTFLESEDVEPTNNAAERALRHGVIWRKLSFGTQSSAGSRFVERLLSVIETCRQQNRNVFEFVTEAVQAHFANRPAPSLLNGV